MVNTRRAESQHRTMGFHIPHYNWYGRGFKLRAAITIACQLAFVLFGYDQGVFSGIVGNADFLDTFNHPSPGLEGIIVSIYNLGCFTGCILSFIFCERTGRRLAMWIAMIWIIVSGSCYLQEIVANCMIGWCHSPNNCIQRAAHNDCSIHHGYWNWH